MSWTRGKGLVVLRAPVCPMSDDAKSMRELREALEASQRRIAELEAMLPTATDRMHAAVHRSAFETSPVSALVFDRSGALLLANERSAKLHRFPSREALLASGWKALDFSAPDHRKTAEEHFAHVLDGCAVDSFRTTLRRLDGSTFPSDIVGVPVKDDEGKIVGLLGIADDATDRQRVEEEMLRAQKLESLSLLAGGIAHDFNNVLTGILGNIGLARIYGDDAARVRARLAEAELAIERARGLTQQLLTFARDEAPVTRSLSLRELVVEATQFALRGSASSCELDMQEDLWPVEADESQLDQVLNNLVINAKQAMSGGGSVRVSARNVEIASDNNLPAGRYVEVCVADEGSGIPPALLARIFDPYFTTKTEGSGLGLATTASIIRRHGGDVAVESAEGQGTVFRIRLPASGRTPVHAVRSERALAGQGRILVMDDDETVLDVVRGMLAQLGYRAHCTLDGNEAIRAYRAAMIEGDPYDAVIVDLTVRGGLGGRETVEQLRQIDGNVRAIIASGYANNPVMAGFGDYGFCGVIVKPFTTQDLGRALSSVLSSDAIGHEA